MKCYFQDHLSVRQRNKTTGKPHCWDQTGTHKRSWSTMPNIAVKSNQHRA